MSFALAVLSADQALDTATAGRIYAALCEGEPGDVPGGLRAAPALRAFARDLLAHYPDLDSLPDDAVDESPWSVAPDIGEAHVVMSFVWSRAEEAAQLVRELAGRHGLTVYDPQEDRVIPPGGGPARWSWQFWRR